MFGNVGADAGVLLRRQRIETVQRIAELATERRVDGVLVAGDVIAGKIAAEEYERLLNIASRRMYGRPLRREKGAAGQLLADIAARGVIDLALVTELLLVWDLRNRVVHPDNQPVTPEEVERMVETVERVCRPWGSSTERFRVAKPSK